MGKHTPGDVPRTGNGQTGGKKPPRGQVSITTAGGSIIWKATAALFGKKKK